MAFDSQKWWFPQCVFLDSIYLEISPIPLPSPVLVPFAEIYISYRYVFKKVGAYRPKAIYGASILVPCYVVRQVIWGSAPALQWRHNDRDDISNHRRLDCLLNRLFKRRSKKTSKFRVIGFCEGNSSVTGEFFAQRVSHTCGAHVSQNSIFKICNHMIWRYEWVIRIDIFHESINFYQHVNDRQF